MIGSAKQSRAPHATCWIASSPFGLLAMTTDRSSILPCRRALRDRFHRLVGGEDRAFLPARHVAQVLAGEEQRTVRLEEHRVGVAFVLLAPLAPGPVRVRNLAPG